MCVFPINVCLSDPDLLMARNDPMMGWCSLIWTERWMRRKVRGCVCLSSSDQLWSFIKLHKVVSISLQRWWGRVVGGKRGHLGWIYQPLGLGPVVWERQSASGMARHGRPEPRVQGREGVTRHENGRLPFEHVRRRGTNKHKGGGGGGGTECCGLHLFLRPPLATLLSEFVCVLPFSSPPATSSQAHRHDWIYSTRGETDRQTKRERDRPLLLMVLTLGLHWAQYQPLSTQTNHSSCSSINTHHLSQPVKLWTG